MAKRKAARGAKPTKTRRKGAARPVKRKASAKKSAPARKPSKKTASKTAAKKKTASRAKPKATARRKSSTAAAGKVPRLDRARRTLADAEPHSTPSSLDMDRRGSAARSGRAGMAQSQRDHQGMSSDLQAGDVDVDIEDAYFTGEEAPGGDNPTPDQDIVEDIGKALGVTYADNEELKASDKVTERDKHRWELDPASAEDFRDRDKE
jgi:hypothetical protein